MHDIYLDWVMKVNQGIRRAEYPRLENFELQRLREYQSKYIRMADIHNTDSKLIIELKPHVKV